MKTEYRIIENSDYLHDVYLQFKDKKIIGGFFSKEKEVECWRYVPDASKCEVSGKYLKREVCIEHGKFTRFDSYEHIGTYFKCESILDRFIHNWPDIDKYFLYLMKRREEYLKTYDPNWYKEYCRKNKEEKQKNIENFKTIYK